MDLRVGVLSVLLGWLCCTPPNALSAPLPGLNPLRLQDDGITRHLVNADGEPQPLFWAEDVVKPDQLLAYAGMGLNTVVVRLAWRPTVDGTPVLEDLQPQRQFAEAAARAGLYVIYALPPAPAGQERAFRLDAANTPYMLLWSGWVTTVVQALQDTPNLIGWMLPDDPRALNLEDDAGFHRWLKAHYASEEVISRQWKTLVKSFDEVTLQGVRDLVTAWRGPGPVNGPLTEEELRERFRWEKEHAGQRPLDQNFAFHPATLALADYSYDTFRLLQDSWARVVQHASPGALVFSGRLTDYAELLALPDSVALAVPAITPDLGETDTTTHNPQQIAIARHGGRKLAFPVFSTAPGVVLTRDEITGRWPHWTGTALAEGAAGFVCASWTDVQANELLRRAVSASIASWMAPAAAPQRRQDPVATAAVLLSPLAEGYGIQVEPQNPLARRRGLYGFGDDLVTGEPSDLVYGLRWGTAFGSLDYFTPEDLHSTQDAAGREVTPVTRLHRYSVVLLPQTLSVPDEAAYALVGYATAGGTVVADLGVGAAQAEGQVQQLSLPLSTLFGIAREMVLTQDAFNLQSLVPHPLWPGWCPPGTVPGTALSGGNGAQPWAFMGPLGYPILLPRTVPVAMARELPQKVGPPDDPILRLQRSCLTVNPLDQGFGIYAPFRLWTFWHPGQPGFDTFHGDLLARGAALTQLDARTLVPQSAGAVGPGYPALVNRPGCITLLDHTTPTPDVPATIPHPPAATPHPESANRNPQPAVASDPMPHLRGHLSHIQTSGVGNFLWQNALVTFASLEAMPQLSGGRPAPISQPDEFESRPHLVNLVTATNPGEIKTLQLLPIRIQNLGGGPLTAWVEEFSPQRIRLLVWPNASQQVVQAGEPRVVFDDPGTIRISVFENPEAPGGYRLLPRSQHQVVVTDWSGKLKKGKPVRDTTVETVTGDALSVDVAGIALQVEITPKL